MHEPPIGVKPAWFVIPERIKELSDAISRYSEHDNIMSDKQVCETMKKWSIEIIGHCDTIEKLLTEK